MDVNVINPQHMNTPETLNTPDHELHECTYTVNISDVVIGETYHTSLSVQNILHHIQNSIRIWMHQNIKFGTKDS